MSSEIPTIDQETFESLMSDTNILFLATNDIEHNQMLEAIKSDSGKDGIKKYIDRSNVYYIGKFGSQKIIYTKISEMGVHGTYGSILTTARAIKVTRPLYVVMLGVAASMDDKIKIGDVVVAKEIITYQDIKHKDDPEGKEITIYRSKHYYPGDFYVIFDNITNEQFKRYQGMDSNISTIHKSKILSGSILLNSRARKAELKKDFVEAGALEMEGYGVAAAAIADGVKNWILIKGICDKGCDKDDEDQTLAMNKAIKLCRMVFDDSRNFHNLCPEPSKLKSIFISGSHNKSADELEKNSSALD